MGKELYIGAQNGIVLCIDGIDDRGCRGCFFHAYQEEAVPFESLGEMLFRIEEFLDRLNFPRKGNSERSFTDNHEARQPEQASGKVVTDSELLERRGEKDTFILRIQHRQNCTWQGRMTWVNRDRTVNFLSVWELVNLIEKAVFADTSPEEMPRIASWEDA